MALTDHLRKLDPIRPSISLEFDHLGGPLMLGEMPFVAGHQKIGARSFRAFQKALSGSSGENRDGMGRSG
jgi:hypothetical protein